MAQSLLRKVNRGYTDIAQIMTKYDQLDREVIGTCNKAEQRCKPTIAGKYNWSPKLTTAIKSLPYWRQRLRSKEETFVISKLGQDIEIEYVSLSRAILTQKVTESRQQLKHIQSKTHKHRQSQLEELAHCYAEQNNVSQQTAIQELILSQEERREMFKALLQRNRIHLTQASKTPFAKGSLRQSLKWEEPENWQIKCSVERF